MPFQIPSWLDVSPSDYLRATQAGAQMGHAIAESTQRAWEEQQRMQMAAQQQEARMQQLAVENAQQRLAADRLEAYRKAQLENSDRGLDLREGSLNLREQRAADSDKFRELASTLRQSEYERKKAHDEAMLDLQKGRLDLAADKLNASMEKPVYHKIGEDLVKIEPNGTVTKITVPETEEPEGPGLFRSISDFIGITNPKPKPDQMPIPQGVGQPQAGPMFLGGLPPSPVGGDLVPQPSAFRKPSLRYVRDPAGNLVPE